MYFILHNIDAKRNINSKKPPSTLTTKLAMLFFSFIITSVFFYLFWDTSPPKVVVGGDNLDFLENSHLNYITEDIQTGFPLF